MRYWEKKARKHGQESESGLSPESAREMGLVLEPVEEVPFEKYVIYRMTASALACASHDLEPTPRELLDFLIEGVIVIEI